MQIVSLHPLDLDLVRRYVAALQGAAPDPAWRGWFDDRLRVDSTRMAAGDELAANRVTLGLARALAGEAPVFVHQPFGLSFWEAQVDRPLGMLMRPPARLFQEAGVDAGVVRGMPIRLDLQQGMMGGAYIPARLTGQALQLIDDHLERSVKRLAEAEYDALAIAGLMHEAVAWANERGVGVYEAMDVVGPGGEGAQPGTRVVTAEPERLDPALRARMEVAMTPPKRPGLLRRLFSRGSMPAAPNGRDPG